MLEKIKTYKIATNISETLWFTNGVITFASIYSEIIHLYISVIVGLIFIMIGIYTYLKVKNILKIIEHSGNMNKENVSAYKQLLLHENIFTFISIAIGLLVFYSLILITLGDRLPVF